MGSWFGSGLPPSISQAERRPRLRITKSAALPRRFFDLRLSAAWAAIAVPPAPPLPSRAAMIAVASITTAPAPTTLARTARTARFARCGGHRQLFFRRWRKKRLARQTDLAGVGLDADDLHFDFIAELHQVSDLTDARVRHLGDVQQSILTGKDLDKCAVRLDALDRSLVV